MARRVDESLRKYRFIDRMIHFEVSAWAEAALVFGLAVLALIVQGVNMLHYPTLGRLGDEGIYMSQAWALLREGRLAPYTYWYDHAPAGWILIAGWMGLLGGPHAFGTAIDTGRVLMLLLHLGAVLMMYFLSRRLGISVPLAGLAGFLMAVSPLAITYQRMVLLDNIMIFWILLSLILLVGGNGRLERLFLSGMVFGVAILSKEPAVLLLPAMLYIAYRERGRQAGWLSLGSWFIPMLAVVSLYPLYALLRGELLPLAIGGQPLSSTSGVYLVNSAIWQSGRGGGGSILNPGSMFWQNMRLNWTPVDPFLIAGGIVAVIANLARGLRDRRFLAAGLLGFLPFLYLARGGLVYDFYIVFALPFFSLNLALLLDGLFGRYLPQFATGPLSGALALVSLGFYMLSGQMGLLYQSGPDDPYRQALAWIESNVSPSSRIIIPDTFWTDLHEPPGGKTPFVNAQSYWKVGSDPQVRDGVFHNRWQMVDDIILLPGMRQDFQNNQITVAQQALEHATQTQRWQYENQFVEVWQVNNGMTSDQRLLESSYQSIKANFSHNGAYANPDGSITSENESEALLRAAWINDKDEFYRTWTWVKGHLLSQNGLLSWQYKDGKVSETSTAANADTNTALALLFAGKRWNDPILINAGTQMAQAIWQHEVVTIAGKPYLAAGDWAVSQNPVAMNPSYFTPYAYRIFAIVDPGDGWSALVDSGYLMIASASTVSLHGEKPAGLPPDWIGMDKNTGQLVPLSLPNVPDTTQYGYIAPRTYWQIALDQRYSQQDGRPQSYLGQASFIRGEVTRQGYLGAIYTREGKMVAQAPSMVGVAGALGVLSAVDPNAAAQLYQDQIIRTDTISPEGMVTWGDPGDLYTQEWAWFAISFYANQLPNLWWYTPPGG